MTPPLHHAAPRLAGSGRRTRTRPRPQPRPGTRGRLSRGLATLASVLTLLGLAAWAAAPAQRAVAGEVRAAASHLRAAEAFEAAQGGLDFALALLQAGPLDATCQPAAGAGRPLAHWLELGPVELACQRQATGWACQCPGAAAPGPPPSAGAPTAAFRVQATRAGSAAPVLLRAHGQGRGGAGTARLSLLVAAEPGPAPARWRRVPGSWRDF